MKWQAEAWPHAGHAVLSELAGAPGRFGLLLGEDAGKVADTWAASAGQVALSVGRLFSEGGLREDSIEQVLEGHTFLTALDVLFWPDLRVDVLALLRRLARRGPVVAAWPGNAVRGRAVYSEPGRRDHYDRPLEDCVLLRTRPTTFPDQVPFEIERIPA